MPRKIVINKCYGGFGLSDQAMRMFRAATKDVAPVEDDKASTFSSLICDTLSFSSGGHDIARDHPDLVRIVEELGTEKASGWAASLAVVEIPDDVPDDGWIIQEYDGDEWVAEKHRTWR